MLVVGMRGGDVGGVRACRQCANAKQRCMMMMRGMRGVGVGTQMVHDDEGDEGMMIVLAHTHTTTHTSKVLQCCESVMLYKQCV